MQPNGIYKYSRYYVIVAVLLLPAFIYTLGVREYNNAEFADGKIIHGIEGRAGRTGRVKYYYPQYEFRYRDSIYYNAREGYDARDFPVGSKVKIFFPANRPQESSIYTFAGYWLARVEIFYYIMAALILYVLPAIFWSVYKDIKNKDS